MGFIFSGIDMSRSLFLELKKKDYKYIKEIYRILLTLFVTLANGKLLASLICWPRAAAEAAAAEIYAAEWPSPTTNHPPNARAQKFCSSFKRVLRLDNDLNLPPAADMMNELV
ncbi:unnamed protein product [Ceratitis capitata]|uniref:(Mediterranean fruit fly) hypothetical protein n=1 Tax=Ceratitis capitata TaxID=7213 RepID=A0A811VIZ2_CERCA|nr:unnamed protein product [Ceratitis capitata]